MRTELLASGEVALRYGACTQLTRLSAKSGEVGLIGTLCWTDKTFNLIASGSIDPSTRMASCMGLDK